MHWGRWVGCATTVQLVLVTVTERVLLIVSKPNTQPMKVTLSAVSGHRRASIDIGIGQTLGSDVLLMPLSVAELRFIDSVDKRDVPRGFPAHVEEEIETQIPELAMSRTRCCTEPGRLLGRDAHNVAEC
jgi:hypothetical protein